MLGCLVHAAGAQELIWPTDASPYITSTFGEFRSGHLHAGIDIKTWGKVGYPVYAVGDGVVEEVEVSPYGYGRAVFLRLETGYRAVYAHLSRFSPVIERRVRAEQKKRGRFAVRLQWETGTLRVRQGEILGYTGRSGTRAPHLHFEIWDREGQPVNPFLLGFLLGDSKPPVVTAVSVTPLSYGSHVEGDFHPKVIPVQKRSGSAYAMVDEVRVWGRVGLAVSAYDRTDDVSNRVSPYSMTLRVDGREVFSSAYDRFPKRLTRQVFLDRDYRLLHWGKGLFQKLYRDVGNTLPFYSPSHEEAGVLCCWDESSRARVLPHAGGEAFPDEDYPEFLAPGHHTLQIEVEDFWGNRCDVEGVLNFIPYNDFQSQALAAFRQFPDKAENPEEVVSFNVNPSFYPEAVRIDVRSSGIAGRMPRLMVGLPGYWRMFVPLVPVSRDEFVGVFPWEEGSGGLMMTEVRIPDRPETDGLYRDTLEVAGIVPGKGGEVVSADGNARLEVPVGSLYAGITGWCREDPVIDPAGIIGRMYTFYPQDVPLKGRITLRIRVDTTGHIRDQLGIYRLNPEGEPVFVGRGGRGEWISARTRRLGGFTVLKDSIPPEVRFIRPGPGRTIRDRTPEIRFGMQDAMSGIYGEENYLLFLDGERSIVEYDPFLKEGKHAVESPLTPGRHRIRIVVTDQAGNTTHKDAVFTVR
jgi:hypothetical protein